MPSNLLGMSLLVAVVLRWRRLLVPVVGVLALVVLLPVGLWLHQPLEDRFARPAALPERVDGIIVLGGAQEQQVATARGVLALSRNGERLIEGLALAQRHPGARLVFSGRSGVLGGGGGSEQVVNEIFLELARFPMERVLQEDRSRNTWENALYTRELVQPGADEVWLLVTSAAHMPRSIGIFRRLGWPVVPWPVDYQSAGGWEWPSSLAAAARLDELDLATREWLGLLAYRLMGRTDALFPGP